MKEKSSLEVAARSLSEVLYCSPKLYVSSPEKKSSCSCMRQRVFSSSSFYSFTLIHLEALILALFNRLRALWFGFLGPFSTFPFSKPSAFEGLSRVVATLAVERFSNSLFSSTASLIGAQPRSLGKEACYLWSGVLSPLP